MFALSIAIQQKSKVLIRCAVLQHICAFDFAYAKSRFTHNLACIKSFNKALISCAITVQLICAFDFAYTCTKRRFYHDAPHIKADKGAAAFLRL